MQLTPFKTFSADERGFVETSAISRYSTFNFEKYKHADKEAFENLFICNDDSIAGGKLTFFLSREESFQLFLPVTGGIDVVSKGEEFSVETGEALILNLDQGEVLEISNPYPNDVVNYIQLGIKNNVILMENVALAAKFDFEKSPNQLIELVSFEELPFRLSIGILADREEAIYTLQRQKNKFFTFILDGTFKIEGREMHARDGFALWDTERVALEAKRNNAIVLVLEML